MKIKINKSKNSDNYLVPPDMKKLEKIERQELRKVIEPRNISNGLCLRNCI